MSVIFKRNNRVRIGIAAEATLVSHIAYVPKSDATKELIGASPSWGLLPPQLGVLAVTRWAPLQVPVQSVIFPKIVTDRLLAVSSASVAGMSGEPATIPLILWYKSNNKKKEKAPTA
jgi:hypothetical protein